MAVSLTQSLDPEVAVNPWVLEKHEIVSCKPGLPIPLLRIIGLIQDAIYIIGKFFYQMIYPRSFSNEIVENSEGNSKALVVLLHGLNSDSGNMRVSRRALERKHGDKLAFLQPSIHKKGNCSLNEAAEQVYETVLRWAESNPGKQIIFSGVSNGARISGKVATQLKTENNVSNSIKVHAIAGPFFGSRSVNQPKWPKIAQRAWRYLLQTSLFRSHTKEILDELSWGSERSIELINEVRRGAESGVDFNFYATYGDFMVRSATSCFPRGVSRANYHMMRYQGHTSIIKAVSRSVAAAVNLD